MLFFLRQFGMAYSDKHLFFDLDRTLWDFDKNSETALRILFADHQLHTVIPSFEAFYKVYKNRNQALWIRYSKGKMTKEALRYERFRSTLSKFNLTNETLTKEMGDGYVDLSPKQTHLLPYAKEVLIDLRVMGFNLHISTNGFVEVQHVKLLHAGLTPFVSNVICSEDIGYSKPNLKIFSHAMRLANTVPSKSLMIGDDYHADVSGAIKAGMHAIWYEPNEMKKSKYEYKITCLREVPTLAARLLQ
jgi:putative hydrolase of the HAD superfamily